MDYEQQYPEPTVGALISNPEGRLFLMRSHKWGGRFVMPGGHVELGENLQEAVLREVLEETALHITDIRFICFQEFIFGNTFYKKRHYIFFDYCAKTTDTAVTLNNEAEDFVWIHPSDRHSLDIEVHTANVIDRFLAMGLSPLKS